MAQNEIFYEKYRPKHVAHILGQNVVVNILKQSCALESFHHSYLLSGKHGTGKTSVARLLAAILTCENRKPGSVIVCHKCPGCIAAYGTGSSDIQELDAASNSGIDNIRAIIDGSRYSPQDLKKRVFILDECHRLSSAAMTSLLKTLEEPPSTAVFIMCTTDFDKVPPEIKSRCMKLFFPPIPAPLISSFLTKLFASRKVEAEQLALDCIARAARGSVRDALEISQEVMLLSGEKVAESDVTNLVGMAGREEVYSLVTAISNDDLLGAFDVVETVLASGISPQSFLEELGEVFRNIMIANVSSKFVGQLVESERGMVEKLKGKFSVQRLATLLPIFEGANKAFGVNVNSRWVLEAVVVKITENID